MANVQKYRILTRDRHDILWTSKIYQEGTAGTFNIKYGLHYNFYAATDARNIANTGWHVPTLTEFNTLVTFLGGASESGGKLKETGYIFWNYPNYGADNSSGFFARGSGFRSSAFSQLKELFDIWFSTEYSASHGYCATAARYDNASSATGINLKFIGFALRLIKDDANLAAYTGNDGKAYNTVKIGNQVWLAENLCETKYRTGDAIPEVTDPTAWAALETGALCAYDNDWSNAYSEGYTDLVGAGDEPLTGELTNESDDIFDQIKPSRNKISVWSKSMFAFADLCSSQDMSNLVEVYQETNLYWKGYIDPSLYEEPYGPVPYQADIYCTDGLSLLKNILYEYSEGIPYNGRKFESEIVLDILGKIGFTGFREFINIYAVGMNSDVGDSPFDQLKIDVDVFADMYCDEVLKEILKKYGACILQEAGIFSIYRVTDLNKSIVYGRYFTAAQTKTPVTLEPLQYIRRSDHQTEFLEVKTGKTMYLSQARKVTIKQDYGNKESWIDNYQFKSNTFTYIDSLYGYSAKYWTRIGAMGMSPAGCLIPGETEGVIIWAQDTAFGKYIKQTFGNNAKPTSDKLGFSFEYMYYNTSKTTQVDMVFINLEIKDTAGTRWLEAMSIGNTVLTEATWETSQHYIVNKENSPPGITEWKTFEREIPGLPVAGPYQISIFAPYPHDPLVYIGIKNVKFYATGSAISLKSEKKIVWAPTSWFLRTFTSYQRRKKEIYYFPSETKTVVEREYSTSNSINGRELKYDCMLGDVSDAGIDNVAEQFAGSLVLASDLSPTTVWNTRGGSENKPLLQILSDEIAMQFNRPKQFLDLPIMEITRQATALKLTGSFQDSINIVNNHLRVFIINRGIFNIKYRTWKFDLIEIGYGGSTGGIPANALLNENGEPILNENGDYILTTD